MTPTEAIFEAQSTLLKELEGILGEALDPTVFLDAARAALYARYPELAASPSKALEDYIGEARTKAAARGFESGYVAAMSAGHIGTA